MLVAGRVTGQSAITSSTTNTYSWWDSASQGTISYKPDVTQGTVNTSTFAYDAFGQLLSAHISDGRVRDVAYQSDGSGQIIHRDERDYVNQDDPHEEWYRFGGREMLYLGNNGSALMNAQASAADRQIVDGTGAFRHGATYATSVAVAAQSVDPINSYRQGSVAGSYVVQADGETLRTVALQLWAAVGRCLAARQCGHAWRARWHRLWR